MSITSMLLLAFETIGGLVLSVINSGLMDVLDWVTKFLFESTTIIFTQKQILLLFSYVRTLAVILAIFKVLMEIFVSSADIVEGIHPFDIIKNAILGTVGVFAILPISQFIYYFGVYVLEDILKLLDLPSALDTIKNIKLTSGFVQLIIFITLIVMLLVLLYQFLKRTADFIVYIIIGHIEVIGVGSNYESFAIWIRCMMGIALSQSLQMALVRLGLFFLMKFEYFSMGNTNGVGDVFLGFACLIGAIATPNYVKEKMHITSSGRALSSAMKGTSSVMKSAKTAIMS